MFEAEQQRVDAAQQAADAIYLKQAPTRNRIFEELQILDKELQPTSEELTEAQARLQDVKNRAIGPWRVDRKLRWWSGNLDLYGTGGKEWYQNRVWLRVVTSSEPEWQARIWGPDNSTGDTLKLGPPTNDPAADWARVSAITVARCQEMGLVVVPGEWCEHELSKLRGEKP